MRFSSALSGADATGGGAETLSAGVAGSASCWQAARVANSSSAAIRAIDGFRSMGMAEASTGARCGQWTLVMPALT